MYRFSLMICVYKLYLAYQLWKKHGFQSFSLGAVFGEDTNTLMHVLGVAITAFLASKLLEVEQRYKRFSDLLFLLCITEVGMWLRHYAGSLDVHHLGAALLMEHLPSSSLYCLLVVVQERHMDAENAKVAKAYTDMERMVSAAAATAAAASSPLPGPGDEKQEPIVEKVKDL